MDLSRFKTSDWLKIGGAIGFLIFGFFDWVSTEFNGVDTGSGGNVFDFFWTGTLPWILVIGSGVVTFLLAQGIIKKGNTPWDMIMLVALGLAALLLLIRILFNPIDGSDLLEAQGVEINRGIGMWLSVISGLVAAAGGFLGFKESGGSLDDFKKLTANRNTGAGAGASGGGMAPPPPPGGRTPPPPPPPPPPVG